MAHKKAGGSSRNGRDSIGRRLGVKKTGGQRVLAGLEAVLAATAERVLTVPLDKIASATLRADIASMRHETQYTRLFRSYLISSTRICGSRRSTSAGLLSSVPGDISADDPAAMP